MANIALWTLARKGTDLSELTIVWLTQSFLSYIKQPFIIFISLERRKGKRKKGKKKKGMLGEITDVSNPASTANTVSLKRTQQWSSTEGLRYSHACPSMVSITCVVKTNTFLFAFLKLSTEASSSSENTWPAGVIFISHSALHLGRYRAKYQLDQKKNCKECAPSIYKQKVWRQMNVLPG